MTESAKHLVVIFHNIGGYHAARLRATQAAGQRFNWRLTAVETTSGTNEHPWGDLTKEITFPVSTLFPTGEAPKNKGLEKSVARRLLGALDELRPNAVAIPGWGFPESRAALSWCRRHQALALLMSESKRDDEPRRWWKELVKSRLYVRRFDAALVGGELHRSYLIKLGFPEERIFLGYDVVDNDYFQAKAESARQNAEEARRREPRIPNRPFFLAATRLIARKNVARLVEAFSNYRLEVGAQEAWDLVVCGSGVEESAIRQLIWEKKLNGRVHLPGFISYQEIGDWYGLASAFVHPAWQEQWGLVINEACAAGLPVLSSRSVGAAHEIVKEGENGFLFDPHSTPDITQALVNLHRTDAQSRAQMGLASRDIIEQYAPQRFGDALMNGLKAASVKESQRASFDLARS